MKSVLVTGASTGLGKDCALELARRNWHVFAGVRKKSDADKLNQLALDTLTPVILDVTDIRTVRSSLAIVEEHVGESGLCGLVNNAGITVQGPLELVSLRDFQKQLEVNVTGQVAVTQAFLPHLRRARGRIVFMSSESGRFTLPLVGPYSASKFALGAVANAFRMELRPFGINVSLVEPGSIETEIWDKAVDATEAFRSAVSDEARALYESHLNALVMGPRKFRNQAIPAKRVTKAVIRALTSRWPRARYVVGMEARLLILFHRLAPTFLSDRIKVWLMKRLGNEPPVP